MAMFEEGVDDSAVDLMKEPQKYVV